MNVRNRRQTLRATWKIIERNIEKNLSRDEEKNMKMRFSLMYPLSENRIWQSKNGENPFQRQ